MEAWERLDTVWSCWEWYLCLAHIRDGWTQISTTFLLHLLKDLLLKWGSKTIGFKSGCFEHFRCAQEDWLLLTWSSWLVRQFGLERGPLCGGFELGLCRTDVFGRMERPWLPAVSTKSWRRNARAVWKGLGLMSEHQVNCWAGDKTS